MQNATELNGSINTFYLKKNRYEKVFGDKAFEESARGSVSSFFGLSQKVNLPIFGQISVGLAFINPDAALSDENALIENEPDPNVIRYHRTTNIRSGASQVILGAAKKISAESGFGCAAAYLDVDELEQIYQDVVQGPFTFEELPDTSVYSTLGQNVRTHLVMRGGSARCGIRIGLKNGLRLGLSYQHSQMVYQRLDYDQEINKVFTDANNTVIQVPSSSKTNLKGTLLRSVMRSTQDNFVSEWPDELRLGFAYQAKPFLTLTADIVRHGPGDGSLPSVKRREILNFAAGSEIILGNIIFIRTGYFTNTDATASRDLSSDNQRKEYIDYKGVSLSTGLRLRNGDYGLHYTEQRGFGLAEKVPGKSNPTTGRLQVISISASQSFQ